MPRTTNRAENPRPLTPQDRPLGGACQAQFALWILGNPDDGTITFPVTVKTDSGDVTEDVTFSFDASPSAPDNYSGDPENYIDSALAEHSAIEINEVVAKSPGGSMPGQVMRFHTKGTVPMSKITIGDYTNDLTGGWRAYAILDRCCGEKI